MRPAAFFHWSLIQFLALMLRLQMLSSVNRSQHGYLFTSRTMQPNTQQTAMQFILLLCSIRTTNVDLTRPAVLEQLWKCTLSKWLRSLGLPIVPASNYCIWHSKRNQHYMTNIYLMPTIYNPLADATIMRKSHRLHQLVLTVLWLIGLTLYCSGWSCSPTAYRSKRYQGATTRKPSPTPFLVAVGLSHTTSAVLARVYFRLPVRAFGKAEERSKFHFRWQAAVTQQSCYLIPGVSPGILAVPSQPSAR